jgi:serine/threonine protein phosphatase PrpC
MIGGAGGGGGGSHSEGAPAAVPGPSRRHRNRNSQVPVHTGTPVTKTEKSVRSGCHSIEGVKPGNPNWSNQDNFFLVEDVSGPSLHIWGVFDGHGGDGHHVSKICRERFPQVWKECDQNMPAAFKKMQTELEKAPCDARCAGATAVVVVFRNGKLEVGNCGDSRAVLGRRKSGQVTAVGLTIDHKPDRPDERRRVLAAGGQVGSRQLVVGHNSKGPVTMPLGPARVWYTTRGETMGLAMSRSLGDCIVHTMGVSAEPEMSEHVCDSNDLFLIIATDGIWDVIESAQAVQLVAQHLARATAQGGPAAPWDVSDAATVLATTARRRWESLSPMVDDITAIVVDLRPVHPS